MNNETKQTAVEWLVEQLEKHYVKIDIINTTVFYQANEMFKEQMIDAWSNGYDEEDRATSNPLNYYNETYGGNK